MNNEAIGLYISWVQCITVLIIKIDAINKLKKERKGQKQSCGAICIVKIRARSKSGIMEPCTETSHILIGFLKIHLSTIFQLSTMLRYCRII